MHHSTIQALTALLLLATGPVRGAGPIHVVTSTPDLKDMVESICGDDVKVRTMMKGTENHHAVPLKPSFLVMPSRCDVLVVNGLDYEHAFLPGALMSINNAKIQRGAPNYVDTSRYIKPAEAPARLDPSLGDLHALGSPHTHIDPGNGILMCKAIFEGMSRIYPDRAAGWKPRYVAYVKRVYAKMKELQRLAEATRGLEVVFYHPGWKYLTDRMGWELTGYVEARAGIPPTPKQVQSLVDRMKGSGCRLMAIEMCYSTSIPDYVASQVGAKVIKIPHHTNAMPGCDTYIRYLETLVRSIHEAGLEIQGRKARATAPARDES